MQQTGYLHQTKRRSPTGLALVVLAHAGVLGALALIKGPQLIGPDGPIVVDSIPVPPEPPPVPQPKQREPDQRPSTTWTVPEPPFTPPQTKGPEAPSNPLPPLPPTFDQPGGGIVSQPPADPPAPPPVRREAEYDSRYANALQPPYPPSEERAERVGTVRVRVTIGTNGRVLAVARLMATSDAFWAATQRHALNRWRFRPATVDGRPVQSTKTLHVVFRIGDL